MSLLREDPSASMIRALRVPGIVMVCVLGLLSLVLDLHTAFLHGQFTYLRMVGVGFALLLVLVSFSGIRRTMLKDLPLLLVWFVGSGYLATLAAAALSHHPLDAGSYINHLIFTTLSFGLLPVVPATLATVGASLLLVAVALTRSSVDASLMVNAFLTAGLVGFMSVHGYEIRYERQRSLQRQRSMRDELTGLINRPAALARLDAMNVVDVGTACVVVLKLRNVETVKATAGRAAADLLVERFGNLLLTQTSADTLASRWSTDEFMLFLPHQRANSPRELLGSLQRQLEQADLLAGTPVTFSVGLAELDEETNAVEALEVAQARLQAALRRDRVEDEDPTQQLGENG